jgi:predicted Rossmann fold nucleotide-binding protein DprA/Smf involved in DNA uptake
MAVNLNHVTLSGNLACDPVLEVLAGGRVVCEMKVASHYRARSPHGRVVRAARLHPRARVRPPGPHRARAPAQGQRRGDRRARVLAQAAPRRCGQLAGRGDRAMRAVHRPAGAMTVESSPPRATLRVAGGRERLRELLAHPLVAVVGARYSTYYGREVAGRLARELTLAGVTVVAGLTEGIEACAHHAVLEAGGRTIAVVPGDPRVSWPAAQRHLHAQVLAHGCVVSSARAGADPRGRRPPRTRALTRALGAQHARASHARASHARTADALARRGAPLLARNHLIAALAQVTVIVEATAGAYAMHTADAALALGRQLAAVPGRITDEGAGGPNLLIRDGAVPVLEAGDVLGLLGAVHPPLAQPGYSQMSSLNPAAKAPSSASNAPLPSPSPCARCTQAGAAPRNSTRRASTHTASASRPSARSHSADWSDPSTTTRLPAYR